MSSIHHIDTTITSSETEALLLEHNFIKLYQPRYNVLLRDDKSYPFILLTKEHHPRITSYRGTKKIAGEYFGPYPSCGAVRETLSLMQNYSLFVNVKIRFITIVPALVCNIKSGVVLQPCVPGYVTDEEYNQQVELARLFLQGKDQQVLDYLIGKMEQASRDLDFEGAARYRDQIQAVRAVIEKQFVSNERLDDMDIMSIAYQHGLACVQVMFIRQGKVLGNRSYFPKVPANTDLSELTATFVGQFYLQGHQGRSIPNSIIVDHKLDEKAELEALLTEQAGRKVVIQESAKGDKGICSWHKLMPKRL